ncbi:hypothetical protein Neosp_015134 [[Neocosmospora] mangrovei]
MEELLPQPADDSAIAYQDPEALDLPMAPLMDSPATEMSYHFELCDRATELGLDLSYMATSTEKITLNTAAKIIVANAASGSGLELKLSLEMTNHLAELGLQFH